MNEKRYTINFEVETLRVDTNCSKKFQKPIQNFTKAGYWNLIQVQVIMIIGEFDESS